MRIIYCLMAVMLLCAVPANADTVVLKSGETIEGRIVEQTNEFLRIESAGAERLIIAHEIASLNGQAYASPVVWGDVGETGRASVQQPLPVLPAVPAETPVPEPISEESVMQAAKPETSIAEDLAAEDMEYAPPAPESVMSAGFPKKTERDEYAEMVKKAPEFLRPLLASPLSFIKWIFLIILIAYLLTCFCLMRISVKTGLGKPVLAWIPIANLFLMCDLAGLGYAWVLVFFASALPIIGGLIGVIGFAYIWGKIAVNLNRPAWMGWLMTLPGFSMVIMLIFAFTDARPQQEETAPAAGGTSASDDKTSDKSGPDAGFQPYKG